jgi:hypothetical protein
MRLLLLMLFVCPVMLAGSDAPSVSFGNDYLQRCKVFTESNVQEQAAAAQDSAIEDFQLAYCAGYTEGLQQMLLLSQARKLVCLPEGVQTVQIGRVITKWIKDHPEEAHELTVVLAREALTKAFPCSKK